MMKLFDLLLFILVLLCLQSCERRNTGTDTVTEADTININLDSIEPPNAPIDHMDVIKDSVSSLLPHDNAL